MEDRKSSDLAPQDFPKKVSLSFNILKTDESSGRWIINELDSEVYIQEFCEFFFKTMEKDFQEAKKRHGSD